MAKWTVRHYCECGAAFQLETDNAEVANRAYAIYKKEHMGLGHKEVSAQKARLARRSWDKSPEFRQPTGTFAG